MTTLGDGRQTPGQAAGGGGRAAASRAAGPRGDSLRRPMTAWGDGRQTPGKPVGGGETPAVIETKGLAKTYGQVTALKPLDLGVARGSIFGFLGPNGAGKSTTMKLLLGLTRPTSGSGSVFGNDIVSESFQIRRRVGSLAPPPPAPPPASAAPPARRAFRSVEGSATSPKAPATTAI